MRLCLMGTLRRTVRGVPSTHDKEDAVSAVLPAWPQRTVAVLSTVDPAPHAIPVSAPVRVGDDRIRLSLHRSRGSLERLGRRPAVALTVLAEGDVAFTARGHARVLRGAMAVDAEYASVEVVVDAVDDHRQAAFTVEAGVDRAWRDEGARLALGARVAELRRPAGERAA